MMEGLTARGQNSKNTLSRGIVERTEGYYVRSIIP